MSETLPEAPGERPGEQARVQAYLNYWAGKLGTVLVPVAHMLEADLGAAQCINDVPATLRSRLSELAHPSLPLDRWASLTELQRYALVKLSRSKTARNLRPALREFGLDFC
ncbi:nitrate reductase associated protein [Variovorax sp. GT1P44]|uniref:nitrate reductase associated protein n=1 Tax=Variovorax sp. GT1P44 TaxID=3443742 RepID=UPI003F467F0B